MPRAAALLLALALPGLAQASEFFTLKGHGGPVKGLAVAPDGTIASASFDNAVGLWQGTAPRWLDDHRAAVNTVAFAGRDRLISAGDDFRVVLWSLPGGTATELFQHKGKVMGLAVSTDGTRAASASWDGTIALLDLTSDTPPTLLRGHASGVNAVSFAEAGRRLISAGVDGTVRYWDTSTGAETRQLLTNGFGVNTLIATPDWLAYGAVDGVTRIVDPDTGAALADFTLDRRPILAMAYSPAAQRLAVGDGEGYIMVLDTQTWRIAGDFRASLTGPIWALAFSPDGQNIHAAGLDPTVYSWPLDTLDDQDPMAAPDRPYLRDPAEMSNGERQFARKCSICHSLTPDSARRAGPSLHGVFGRPAGALPGYSYSRTLIEAGFAWNETTIDKLFDLGPDHFIPGTKMPMQRITAPQDRADLIAFLRRATSPTGE
ncbi:c-type cytochrome [Fluviibacterium sp. S390]|uniref:c-type cytochrome n=1 Tax=Fluviibacterium sp. S390 TaxID=3415139 RepID=UPI003C79E50C